MRKLVGLVIAGAAAVVALTGAAEAATDLAGKHWGDGPSTTEVAGRHWC
jgi:hypothetical protein